MRLRTGALVLATAATVAALGGGWSPGGAARAAKALPPRALFTARQADEGRALYAQRCAMCHGAALEGTFETPALTGRFVANWAGRPAGDLYAYLGRAMPQFAPGSLSPQDDVRLVAFLLAANGYPPGTTPLPADEATLQGMLLGAPGMAR